MTPTEQRLRQLLLGWAGLVCLLTPLELALTGHTESPTQWVPFLLCVLGVLAIGAALRRPERWVLLTLRAVMVLLVVGSLFGGLEHLEHNLAFEQEIRPNATARDVLPAALQGANPLLAPGILALAGALALTATYGHPSLGVQSAERTERRAQNVA